MVFRGWIERLLKRAVRVGGGKLYRAIRGAYFDVEGACACDHICWQFNDRGLIGEHDRCRVSARSHPGRFFGDYARFGIPITILTIGAGVVVLLVLR